MNRRRFLLTLGFATAVFKCKPTLPAKLPLDVCKLCKKPGHQMEGGRLRYRNDAFPGTSGRTSAIWCKTFGVNWNMYERI